MTKQNASLRPVSFPTSNPFRSISHDGNNYNNINGTTAKASTDSNTADLLRNQSSNFTTPKHGNAASKGNSPVKKEKVYAYDDMSPSRTGLGVTKGRITNAGDLPNDINSAFSILRSATKKSPVSPSKRENYDYSTIYKNPEGYDFEVRRNPPLFEGMASREHSRRPSLSASSRDHSRRPSLTVNTTPSRKEQDAISEIKSAVELEFLVSNESSDANNGANLQTMGSELRESEPATSAQEPESQEFADPIEVFSVCDADWHSYMTEAGDIYYLIMATGHSQWEDPRVSGMVVINYDESVPCEEGQLDVSIGEISRAFVKSPPTSPSPKSPSPPVQTISSPANRYMQEKSNHPLSDIIRQMDKISSFSPVSTEDGDEPIEEDSEKNQSLIYKFDDISVARNFRWLDDSDSCYLEENNRMLMEIGMGAENGSEIYQGSIGIADIDEERPSLLRVQMEVEVDSIEVEEGGEEGPETRSRFL